MSAVPLSTVNVHCWTQALLDQCALDWTIENLSSHMGTTGELKSSPVKTGENSNGEFQLRIRFAKGKTMVNMIDLEHGKNFFLMIDLIWLTPCVEDAHLQFTISYLNSEDNEIKPPQVLSVNYDSYVPIDSDVRLPSCTALPNDSLIIHFELTIYTGQLTATIKPNLTPQKPVAWECLSSVGSMCKQGCFTDLTISVGTEKISAHKLILAAHSPVFYYILQVSPNKVCIEIEGFTVDAVREMVNFMYTHREPAFKSLDFTKELYRLSQNYDLDELKTMCRETLRSKLDTSNSLDLLLLAEDYCDEIIKCQVIDFICSRPDCILDNDMNLSILQRRPELLQDILSCKQKMQMTYVEFHHLSAEFQRKRLCNSRKYIADFRSVRK